MEVKIVDLYTKQIRNSQDGVIANIPMPQYYNLSNAMYAGMRYAVQGKNPTPAMVNNVKKNKDFHLQEIRNVYTNMLAPPSTVYLYTMGDKLKEKYNQNKNAQAGNINA